MSETTNSPGGWGSPEVERFFEEATYAHMATGIYGAYFRALGDLIEDFDEVQARLTGATVSAELPLGVTEGYKIVDDDGNELGASYSLVRVNPATGERLSDSTVWVADVEGGEITSINDFFSAEQAGLLLAQALKQEELGVAS